MKRVLVAALMVLLLTACSRSDDVQTAINELSPLQIILLSADMALDQPRVSVTVYDGPDTAENVTAMEINVVELDDNLSATDAVPVWTGSAENYTDYEIPYWVFYPDVPAGGYWGAIATMTLDDGSTTIANFVLEITDTPKAPALGSNAPPSQNRTLATEPDLSRLSSGEDPNPALYQLTVADAIETGKPTVVGFITPGFCQTQFCTPVLGTVEQVREQVGDEQANFIHVEVYDDFGELTVVPEMAEWGLDTEPWVFVLDEAGQVQAKFSGPLSPRELTDALSPLVGS